MTITYQRDDNDLLQMKRFYYSILPERKKRRMLHRAVMGPAFLVLGILAYTREVRDMQYTHVLSVLIVLLTLCWIIFYDQFDNRTTDLRFKKEIQRYKEKGLPSVVEITDTYIKSGNINSSYQIAWSEIERIDETAGHIFIVAKSSLVFIMPKEKVITITDVQTYLHEIAANNGIPYGDHHDWK